MSRANDFVEVTEEEFEKFINDNDGSFHNGIRDAEMDGFTVKGYFQSETMNIAARCQTHDDGSKVYEVLPEYLEEKSEEDLELRTQILNLAKESGL